MSDLVPVVLVPGFSGYTPAGGAEPAAASASERLGDLWLGLLEGAAGLPVFSGGAAHVAHLLGPTGGYLWSYPFVAGLLGGLVERGASRRAWKLALALAFSDVLILISGTLWLRHVFAIPYREAAIQGFWPFLIGDALKVALVGISLPRILERLGSAGASPAARPGGDEKQDNSSSFVDNNRS